MNHPNDPVLDALFAMFGLPTDRDLVRLERGFVDTTPRLACSPTEPVYGTGYHKHTCRCGTSWKHDDLLPMTDIAPEEFTLAHQCPTCGTEVRIKDFSHG